MQRRRTQTISEVDTSRLPVPKPRSSVYLKAGTAKYENIQFQELKCDHASQQVNEDSRPETSPQHAEEPLYINLAESDISPIQLVPENVNQNYPAEYGNEQGISPIEEKHPNKDRTVWCIDPRADTPAHSEVGPSPQAPSTEQVITTLYYACS